MFSFFKNKNSIGKTGEEAAEKFLKQKRYTVLLRNYFNPRGRRLGEIDIIARDGDFLVFIEVKTVIFPGATINPEERINRSKIRKMEKIASFYLKKSHQEHLSYRFDAISVILDTNLQTKEINHIESIFL